mgnify:CR=1 FL=1
MTQGVGSKKAAQFTESVIREMTRLSNEYDGVNLSQGFPDFPAPEAIKTAACAAIQADDNQYALTWGATPLRKAIAKDFTRRYGVPVNPDTQVTVCCGSTEAMITTLLASVDPGDEVIVFEDHSKIGGLGSAVSEVLSEEYPTLLKRIGLNDVFPESASPSDLWEKYGLSSKRITKSILQYLNEDK